MRHCCLGWVTRELRNKVGRFTRELNLTRTRQRVWWGGDISRPQALPTPAVVVLDEVFGVNADIRKTCDELAYIKLRPPISWRAV
jgi:hypothetical protein